MLHLKWIKDLNVKPKALQPGGQASGRQGGDSLTRPQ